MFSVIVRIVGVLSMFTFFRLCVVLYLLVFIFGVACFLYENYLL
jgi:hypothetical protein